jgi:hypothetical protein
MPVNDTTRLARRRHAIGVAVAAGLLLLASTHAVAANRQDRTLTVVFHGTSFTSTQDDPSGIVFVQGDQLIGAADVLRATSPHERIGSGDLVCIATGAAGATLHCEAAFILPRGKIVTETLFDLEDDWLQPTRKLAITGGTGAYRDAAGELTVTTLASGDETGVFAFSD